ncbi:hypothetical protein BOO36_09315 [Vibrio navarrensis]|uniref:DUF2057 family protein n=1 Tax=Vibrio navarrensis TaxID=29495 RepID=UPI00186AB654|nr:DUF2057 family protein [Vibrio navarrensis]MBE4574045.1 hypothetical protein [Vibrio navarrensis]MBE4587882.1 hypothetical protein [Vibrio navarrensis]
MHVIFRTLASAFFVFTSYSHAASILTVQEDLNILAINMAKPNFSGGLFSSKNELEIPDGVNQIVFQFQPTFERGDRIESVYGQVVIAKFSVFNQKIEFVLPKYRTAHEAKEKIDQLEWFIVDSNGKKLDIVKDILPSSGIQLGRNYAEEAKNYNIAGGIASVAVTYVTANQHQQSVVNPQLMNKQQAVTQNSADSTVLDIMKATYQKASPKDQEAFKKWLLAQ